MAWLHRHAARYGGDPGRIVLMGHSAGCHHVAVLAANSRFLGRHGVDVGMLRAVVCLDTAMYDVPKFLRRHPEGSVAINALPFLWHAETARAAGRNVQAALEAVSPVHHVRRDQSLPPFLVVISHERPDGPHQPVPFAARVRECGPWQQ